MKTLIPLPSAAKHMPALCLLLVTLAACEGAKAQDTTDKSDLDIQQAVAEWQEVKPAIERLTQMEADLHHLFAEISRSANPGSTPAQESAEAKPSSQPASTNTHCPNTRNIYKKSLALASFPRMQPTSSNPGALHQVELHLPMLLGANLHNRHKMLTPLQLQRGLTSADQHGETVAAAQTQQLAQKNRVQFVISGQVNDMSMEFPNTLSSPTHYSRFINGVHNLLHINTRLDKRSRVFSFYLEVRDGITGQRIYNNQYSTFGHWKPEPGTQVGFASARFWQTDYGKQVQHLVAKASDDLAQVIDCQPYMARVDTRPGQNLLVVHSGANNGLRTGDALELYQLVQEPTTGGYQQYDTRLIKRDAQVYLTETYPSHSVAQFADDLLMTGQYVVRAP